MLRKKASKVYKFDFEKEFKAYLDYDFADTPYSLWAGTITEKYKDNTAEYLGNFNRFLNTLYRSTSDFIQNMVNITMLAYPIVFSIYVALLALFDKKDMLPVLVITVIALVICVAVFSLTFISMRKKKAFFQDYMEVIQDLKTEKQSANAGRSEQST